MKCKKLCSCLGTCKGTEGLGSNYVCSLSVPAFEEAVEGELLPCPFCAGSAKTYYNTTTQFWFIQCCRCKLKFEFAFHDDSEAIENWNTRRPAVSDDLKARAEESGHSPANQDSNRDIQAEGDEFAAKGDAWGDFLQRKNPIAYNDSYAGFQFGWNAAIAYMKGEKYRQVHPPELCKCAIREPWLAECRRCGKLYHPDGKVSGGRYA